MREDGIRIAIDDVGAGFASLRHVPRLDPEIIKLDQEITRGVQRDASRAKFVGGLIAGAAAVRMTSRPDNTHYLRAAEQARHAEITQRALDAIRALAAAGETVNFSTVARAAGCSRSFLNRDETLAAEIRRLRPTTATAAQRQGGPAASMTDTSLKARVEQLRGDNARLRTENAKLRSQVAALLEQLRAISTVRSVDA